MGALPVDRTVVIVGDEIDAQEWADAHDVDHYLLATTDEQFRGLDPKQTHLVLLRSWRRRPRFLFVHLEVCRLQRAGASVEAL